MKIEDQVVSLELSRLLKDIGVKQESLFYWEKCPDADYKFVISSNDYHDDITGEWTDGHSLKQQENYSAFIVTELFEILPAMINGSPLQLIKGIMFGTPYLYYCSRYDMLNVDDFGLFSDENAANSLAKMLIYLIKNNLMGIPK